MFETKGIKAVHAIVTDVCRENKGDEAAFQEAVERVLSESRELTQWHERGKGVKFHVILAVEMQEAPR